MNRRAELWRIDAAVVGTSRCTVAREWVVARWQGCFRARFDGSEGRARKVVHALRFFVVLPLMARFIG